MKKKKTIKSRGYKSRKKIVAKKTRTRNRPFHRRILLHPITIVIILCVGVFISAWTYKVIADSYNVTAAVEAPPLLQGATITSPADGSSTSTEQIEVTGTCQSGSYVKLYINSVFSGVDFCSSDGGFQILASLFSGENVLTAQAYNITNELGPTTPNVTIFYEPATPSYQTSTTTNNKTTPSKSTKKSASGTSGSNQLSNPSVPELLLTGDFHYQTFSPGKTFSWQINVEGGVFPYTVNIQWGDGQTSTQVYGNDLLLNISHVYKDQGYYSILVTVVDATGTTKTLQLAALIKVPGSSSILPAGNNSTSPQLKKTSGLINFFDNTKAWLWLAWPSFTIVILMVFCFWLGEQEVYQKHFKKRQRQLKRHYHT